MQGIFEPYQAKRLDVMTEVDLRLERKFFIELLAMHSKGTKPHAATVQQLANIDELLAEAKLTNLLLKGSDEEIN